MGDETYVSASGLDVPPQHLRQLVRDAHGHRHRRPRRPADVDDVLHVAQAIHHTLDHPVAHEQRIAAGDEYITYRRMRGEPIEGVVQLLRSGHRLGHHRAGNLPISLAVDADLGAGVEGFDDGDSGVAPGYQVNR